MGNGMLSPPMGNGMPTPPMGMGQGMPDMKEIMKTLKGVDLNDMRNKIESFKEAQQEEKTMKGNNADNK